MNAKKLVSIAAAALVVILIAVIIIKIISGAISLVAGAINAILGLLVIAALVAIVIWMFRYAKKKKDK